MRNIPTRPRLFLIEDDDLTREFLTIQITAQGYQLETAESGDAALLQLERWSAPLPDAILTDLQMPGISGPELAQRLRSIGRASGSPDMVLLAMSATAPRQDLTTNYDGFLLKPFNMEQLAAALQPVARMSRAVVDPPIDAMTSPPEPAAPCLDQAVFQHLVDAIPADQLQQLYIMFLDDVELRIGRMHAATGSGDDVTYRREAHAIKGGCSMVGAAELHRVAAAAEQKGLNPANHVASLDELLMACERLRRILVGHEIGSST